MAHFTVVQVTGYDMSGTVVSPGSLTAVSESEIDLDFTGTPLVGFWHGSGLAVEGDDIVAGTLRSLELAYAAGGTGYQITGIGKPAAAVYDVFTLGDRQGYFGYLLDHADTVTGSTGDDTLRGFAGKDHLAGGSGNDILEGMNGADTLYGGAGNDELTGGLGADAFLFITRGAANADLVTDFRRGQGDKIALDSEHFAPLGEALDAGEFKVAKNIAAAGGAANGDANILYDIDTGRLYYDADGAATAFKPQLMATFGADTHPVLALGDFILT